MDHSSEKTSADIQREIDADRQRIEARIGAIQDRMSPGQLVDEVLAYAKGSGGAEYVSNLGNALKANPLPVALMGVSLAWLMATKNASSSTPTSNTSSDREIYPLYPASGSIRRTGPVAEIDGFKYSHFADDAGQKFKALTNEAGERAGHFVDDAGKTYRGFADTAGKQISAMSDEAGNMLDASLGWASETWHDIKNTASNAAGNAGGVASSLSGKTANASAQLKDQSARLNDAILSHFRDQPLVGGALAFAVGAAIGAALPHTEAEDSIMGDAADDVKADVTTRTSDVIDRGKDVATEVLDKAVNVVSEVHDTTRAKISEEIDRFDK